MSSAVMHECEVSRESLPVCLYKENSNGLVSLYDVLRIKAYAFISIGSSIQNQLTTLQMLGDGLIASSKMLQQSDSLLGFIASNCVALGLTHTEGIVESIRKELSRMNTVSTGHLRQSLREINRSYVQELDSEIFLHVDAQRANGYFCRAAAFGSEVSSTFPETGNDIWMAGNCFALELYDASVFHLMRVLERGLATLAAQFTVKYEQRNWHNIIEEIEAKIRAIDPTWGKDWKKVKQQYSEAACQFMFFKEAWRNHVMHGRDTYDGKRAKVIHDATEIFMQSLAKISLSQSVP